MTYQCAALVALLCVAGCTSTYRIDRRGLASFQAADGSTSPISEERALALAKTAIAKREHWPEHQVDSDGHIHTVCIGTLRINSGGWVVIAHRGLVGDGGVDCLYDPVPPAVVTIDKKGSISKHARQWCEMEYAAGHWTDL